MIRPIILRSGIRNREGRIMKKKNTKLIAILAVAAVVLAIAFIALYVFSTYRGADGLTNKEARMLEKKGEAVIDWDKYDAAIEFYKEDRSFGEELKFIFSSDNDKKDTTEKDSSSGKDTGNKTDNNKNDDKESGSSSIKNNGTEYEKYISMSPEKQQAYFESFDDPNDFFKWYNNAKAEYDKKNAANVVEGDSVDIGDYMD